MSHDRLEQRSIAFHRAVAEKLRLRPELLAVAFENLDRWSQSAGRSQPYFDEWRAMLALPLSDLLRTMVENTPRMGELRQSTPFAGILEPKERWRVYDTFESGTHHTCGRDDR